MCIKVKNELGAEKKDVSQIDQNILCNKPCGGIKKI